MPYKDAQGSHTCNFLFLLRSPLGAREAGSGMAFPCVWCCRPPRGFGIGSQGGGKEATGGERQFLETSLCVVPQLSEWCDAGPSRLSIILPLCLRREGKKKALQAFSQEAQLCIFCQGVVHTTAPKSCQHAWPHRCCEKLGNCRECFTVLENGAHRKTLLFSKVTLLGAITKNGRQN